MDDQADEESIDIITHELTDNPVETFGVPEEELRDELDKTASGTADEIEDDDMREEIEDQNENDK